MRKLMFLVSALLLVSVLSPSIWAQDSTATPEPPQSASGEQAVLDRADAALDRAEEVAALAEATAELNARTIELVRNLAWFFGIILVIATAILGLYGFSTQRGFQQSLNEYRVQLSQAEREYQELLDDYQAELDKIQILRNSMAEKVQEVEVIREDLRTIEASVTQEFTAAKQAVVLLSMGNRLFGEGKRREAIDVYEEARRLEPYDPQINYHLGRAHSNAGHYDEAIQAFERAVNARPDFAEAQMELGLTYRRHAEGVKKAEERIAEYRLAERYLRRAVELRPAYEDALGALGGLCRREERYQEALDFYRKAAAVDPNSSYALNNIASLSWYLDDIEGARYRFECVDKVATERIESGIPEEDFWDYYDRALARLVLGHREEAMADHAVAIARTPETENYVSVLDNLRFLKRAKECIDGLDEFISMVEDRLPPT